MRQTWQVIQGDTRDGLRSMPEQSAHVCVTSPPYWGLRDYGHAGQIGLEQTPEQYVAQLVEVFREVRRVLRDDGTMWVNLGDSYANQKSGDTYSGFNDRYFGRETDGGKQAKTVSDANVGKLAFPGLKPKDLIGIPWRVAFALRADGWYLRSDIIWAKPNPMPESVTDRCTKSHEYLFLLAKSARYYYDAAAIADKAVQEPHSRGGVWTPEQTAGPMSRNGASQYDAADQDRVWGAGGTRNRRSVWMIATQPFTDWATTYRLDRVSVDAASDDSVRITSPSCPAHAGQPDRVPTAHRGVREVASLFHSLGIGDRLARARAVDSVPSEPIRVSEIAESSSDSLNLSYAQTANGRSTRTRKTGRDPSTSLACTASAQTSNHTADTSASPVDSGSVVRTPESRTAADSVARGTWTVFAQTTLRTACKCVCSCEHYSVKTKETSHFATFPEALVEPCIKAGSPVGGMVLDPFSGSGTTGVVALKQARSYIGCELNPEYVQMSRRRLGDVAPLLAREVA